MKATGKYAFSFNEERDYDGYYNTIDEALIAATIENLQVGQIYTETYIGEVMEFQPKVNCMNVIEHLQDCANEESGEFSEDYLEHISKEDAKKLDAMLTEAFNKWAKETNNEPNFFTVENVKTYEI